VKKTIITILTALTMAIVGCDMLNGNDGVTNGNGTDKPSPGDGGQTTLKYAKELWGEWVRMDTGATWYISSSAITINGRSASTSVSLSKQSDRVIEVSDGGRKYYLYASRTANAWFTGVVAGDAGSVRAIGGGLGGVRVAITNLGNKADELSAVTNADGTFTANDVIPGDSYQITPEGGKPVTVTPVGDGDDIGVITVTNGLNFKTVVKPKSNSTDMTRLYANMNAYELILEIENTGSVDCTAATYQLNFAPDLIAESVPASQILGTIEPGKKRLLK
jgi:hypothetical protein